MVTVESHSETRIRMGCGIVYDPSYWKALFLGSTNETTIVLVQTGQPLNISLGWFLQTFEFLELKKNRVNRARNYPKQSVF